MNQAFSDIAGEAAEAYMKELDWFQNLAFKAENEALRYFIDPTLDGSSLGHMDEYCQPVDVHHSSGIYNRVFYLLTTTPGWKARMSFQEFATANQLYWTPDSSFIEGACGTLQAVRDLGFNEQDGTWRNNNVIITSKRRRFDVIMTLLLRHVPAGVLAAFHVVGINPCGPRFEGAYAINDINGVHNETLYFRFDLQHDDADLLRFETYRRWHYSGDFRMIIETPSDDIISTNTSLENLNVSDPEIGTYTVTFECDDYFEGVALRASRASYVLQDNFIFEDGIASGLFSLPQDVVDAGQTSAIRVERTDATSFSDPPIFALSHEAEVNVNAWIAQIWSNYYYNKPLTRYVKLQVAHAPGMPGTFPPAADFKGNR